MKLKTVAMLSMASTLLAAPAFAYEAGDMVVRGGTATVNVESKSDDISSIVPAVDGDYVSASDETQVGISGTYMFTENWGLELLAATPFEHELEAGSGADIGSVKQLPPTLSAQYFFLGNDSQWQPYVGLGINYTTFFGEKVGTDAKSLGVTRMYLDDSVGLAMQAGVDYMINANWGVNLSVMYADISTTAELKVAGGTVAAEVDYDLDPIVYRLNAVYKF